MNRAAKIILLMPAVQIALFAVCFYEYALFFIFQLGAYLLFLVLMYFRTRSFINNFITNPEKLPRDFAQFNTFAYIAALIIVIASDDYPKYIAWDYIMMFCVFIALLLIVPLTTYIITKIYIQLTTPFLKDMDEGQ